MSVVLRRTVVSKGAGKVIITGNSPSQDYTHLDNQTTLLHVTTGFKPFTVMKLSMLMCGQCRPMIRFVMQTLPLSFYSCNYNLLLKVNSLTFRSCFLPSIDISFSSTVLLLLFFLPMFLCTFSTTSSYYCNLLTMQLVCITKFIALSIQFNYY